MKTSPLQKTHQTGSFSCGQPSLDRYLKEQAGQDMRRNLAVCFVLAREDATISGFYTLSNASIDKEQLPDNIRKKFGYKNLPVTLLGRLAVDENEKGKRVGEFLLLDSLKRSLYASYETASIAVVSDPLNESAGKFYERYGFQRLEDSRRMFLMMKTIEVLFQ